MALSALLDILVILVAAKIAAEASERVKLPAVVGEILAGVLIGPSLLGLVGESDVLSVLAELGVILLLLDVGLEMDLRELGAVGRAALTVAMVGVIVPFVAGAGAGFAMGFDTNEAIFVGAALTATSVGISARVFGDLRALASVEARTVLGAAVADDVLGLIILTVVVRLTQSGSIEILEVGKILLVAVLFLTLSLAIGVKVVPPLFDAIGRVSRSAGTLVALALAFALAVAEVADAAKLAPIVGAFVAGVTLARSKSAERIRSDLAPVGHLFIPVFFLQIGIDAEVERFIDLKVLGMAAALLVVAVLGKIVAAVGLLGAPGDRLLVGLGMIPRGEVGLIFATIGLQQGVFGDDVYATLLIVVLVTTLVTPPLLRLRLLRTRARPAGRRANQATGVEVGNEEVSYTGAPDPQEALLLALEASVHIEERRPTSDLLDLLSGLPEDELVWTEPARNAFVELLHRGGPRSWRFLYVTGVLRRTLPELDEAIATHVADPFDLDPLSSMRWPTVARLVDLGTDGSSHPEQLALAALAVDATDRDLPKAQALAGKMAERIGLGAEAAAGASALAGEAGLLLGTARRTNGFSEESVVQLAAHLSSVDRARDLQRITLAVHSVDGDEREAIDSLVDLVVRTLTEPRRFSASASVDRRRVHAMAAAEDPDVRRIIETAPRAYVLTQSSIAMVRQARLCSPSPRGDQVRVLALPGDQDRWTIEIAAHDRLGLLAHEARVLADAGLDVLECTLATWEDGTTLSVFLVRAFDNPSPTRLRDALTVDLGLPLLTPPAPDVAVHFDDDASPWHTLCTMEGPDRYGLLALVSAAFAAGGANVHAARIVTFGDDAIDQFELTGRLGRKLTEDIKEQVRRSLLEGVRVRRRSRIGRRS